MLPVIGSRFLTHAISLLCPPCVRVEQEQAARTTRCRFVSSTSRCQYGE